MATSKVIELIVKAKDQASKTLDDISKNTEKLNNSLKEVRQISTVATTALVALWGVMVNDAAKTEPVQKAFDWLAESIGENSKRRHPVYRRSVFSLFYYNNSIPVLPINAVSCVLFILVLWNNDP